MVKYKLGMHSLAKIVWSKNRKESDFVIVLRIQGDLDCDPVNREGGINDHEGED